MGARAGMKPTDYNAEDREAQFGDEIEEARTCSVGASKARRDRDVRLAPGLLVIEEKAQMMRRLNVDCAKHPRSKRCPRQD